MTRQAGAFPKWATWRASRDQRFGTVCAPDLRATYFFLDVAKEHNGSRAGHFPALRSTPSGGDIHVAVFLSEFLSTGKMDPLTAQQPVKSA
jgi:hypothetical protein